MGPYRLPGCNSGAPKRKEFGSIQAEGIRQHPSGWNSGAHNNNNSNDDNNNHFNKRTKTAAMVDAQTGRNPSGLNSGALKRKEIWST